MRIERSFIVQQRSSNTETGEWVGTNLNNRTVRFVYLDSAIRRAKRHVEIYPGSICRVITPDGTLVWQSDYSE